MTACAARKGTRGATLASPGLDGCHQAMCDFVLVPVLLGPTIVELALFSIFLTLTGGSQFSGRCYFSGRAMDVRLGNRGQLGILKRPMLE